MDGGEITEVVQLDGWQGTPGQDAGRQLVDLRDAISNLLDQGLPDPPNVAAIKRVERPFKGKPPDTYDDRIRFESAVMVAAVEQGRRCFSYRKLELVRGAALIAQAEQLGDFPTGNEAREAAEAACAGLSDFGNGED
jgi:hypothetical protein